MSNIDFSTEPAKAKCEKCLQEAEVPIERSLWALIKFMEDFEKLHKDCK